MAEVKVRAELGRGMRGRLLFLGGISRQALSQETPQNAVCLPVHHPGDWRRGFEETRQQRMDLTTKITKYISYGSPILALVAFAVIAGALLAVFNFGMGASIRFGAMWAVTIFAHLPNLLKAVLTMGAMAAGMDPDGFDVRNPIATNLGAVVGHTSPALYSLASSIDVFSIWICVLTGIGIASISKVKRGTAIGVVLGVYAFVSLLGAGWAIVAGA